MKMRPWCGLLLLLLLLPGSSLLAQRAQQRDKRVVVTQGGAVVFHLPPTDGAVGADRAASLRERLAAVLAVAQDKKRADAAVSDATDGEARALQQPVVGRPGLFRVEVPLSYLSFAVVSVDGDGAVQAPVCTEVSALRARFSAQRATSARDAFEEVQ